MLHSFIIFIKLDTDVVNREMSKSPYILGTSLSSHYQTPYSRRLSFYLALFLFFNHSTSQEKGSNSSETLYPLHLFSAVYAI